MGDREYSGTLLVAAGDVRYRYDAGGRMVTRQRGASGANPETWRYGWDVEDRLTSVVTPDGQRWQYRYDALGRRIAKQRLGADGRFAEQYEFAWDGAELVEQAHSAPDRAPVVTIWEREPAEGQLVAQIERPLAAGESREHLHQRFYAVVTDLVGSPSELVDETGAVVWHLHTTLWGRQLSPSGHAETPLRFPGQYYDAETGLHYNMYRYYDPDTGRYLSHDPLGLEPAPDSMSYVDNPTVRVDPLGLGPCRSSGSGRSRYSPPSSSQSGSRRETYRAGTHGARRAEQRRLTSRYGQPVSGAHYQSEHPIGSNVLTHASGAQRGQTRQTRHIDNHAPAYQEVRDAHAAHTGTGRNRRPAHAGFSSGQEYRNAQHTALRQGRLGNALQLNQLDYAHQPAFHRTTGTHAGRVADDSFDNMVRNMRGHGVEYATGPNRNHLAPPMSPREEEAARLSRSVVRGGRMPTYDEEVDMLHRIVYRR